MKVTLRTISEHTGLSMQAVSQTLNNTGRISEETRQKVLAAAFELGYRPHTAARAIRTGRTGFIGMVHSPWIRRSVNNPKFEYGVDEAMHERGLCLVRDILDENDEGEPTGNVPRVFREHIVDGLLLNYAFGSTPAIRDYLDRCRIPTIWINRKRDTNCVRPDDHAAVTELTRRLIEHGHRRILFTGLGAYPTWDRHDSHYSGPERLDAYRQAMTAAGLSPEEMILSPDYDNESVGPDGLLFAHFAEKLRSPDRPTAMVCCNLGWAALHAAQRLGIDVPGELSIAGLGDRDTTPIFELAVDIMIMPYWQMGLAAVAEVCELIESPGKQRPAVLVPFNFLSAGTVARPADPA